MYSISDYGDMIADSVRMEAYTGALRKAVTRDSVVVDIGTGTGIFALLACKFGARHVYAIEPSDAILVAQELARLNGYEDRIEFIHGVSTEVELPERADIIISDLRGLLPLYGPLIPSIVDARQRFLAPGGRLIPQCDLLWASLAETSKIYRRHDVTLLKNTCGLDLSAANKYVMNGLWKKRVTADQLLAPPICWAEIDYATVQIEDFNAEFDWIVSRPGTAHGITMWFDMKAEDTIGFSNKPGAPEVIYGQAILPLLEPVPVKEGDIVNVTLSADLVDGDYIWRWNTRVADADDPRMIKADFRQSTFFCKALNLERMRKGISGFKPRLTIDGQIRSAILSLMDGSRSLEEISRRVFRQFPDRYANWQEVLPEVGELSREFSL